jgi:hypothetical protein
VNRLGDGCPPEAVSFGNADLAGAAEHQSSSGTIRPMYLWYLRKSMDETRG